jgi:nucleoside-diphosphate-sugar epimerase
MTAQAPRKILVFGATGVIGKYILQEIVNARSSFDKIGLFTSSSTVENKSQEIQKWKDGGVEVIVGDVSSEEDVKKAYQGKSSVHHEGPSLTGWFRVGSQQKTCLLYAGYDTVVSALGRNAILGQIPLVKAAEASSSIQYFYPSEYGTDIEYGPASATEKPHQLKLQVRKYIRENVKNLNVTYLVTGPYSDLYLAPCQDHRAGSFNVKERKATLLGTGEEKVSFTTMRDVGRLLVAALQTPATSSERVLKVNSFTTTSKAALAEFEQQTGENWDATYTGLEDLKSLEKEAWEKDSGLKTVYTLRRIWTEGGTLYETRDNLKIGLDAELETLADQVKKAIATHG